MSLPRTTQRVSLASSVLVVAATVCGALTACGSSTSTSGGPANPDGGGTSGGSCSDLASAAQKDVAAVVDAHRACTQASDCTTVELSASCFDSCTRSIRKDAAAALKAAQDKADQTQCAQFKSQGCQVTIPPCEPPLAAMCVAGQCTGG